MRGVLECEVCGTVVIGRYSDLYRHILEDHPEQQFFREAVKHAQMRAVRRRD